VKAVPSAAATLAIAAPMALAGLPGPRVLTLGISGEGSPRAGHAYTYLVSVDDTARAPGWLVHLDIPAPAGATVVADEGTKIKAEILIDLRNGQSSGRISAKFHNALTEIILAIARRIGEPRILLTGGCFQNRYLVERAVRRLLDAGFLPYWHQRVPPNDGGIALGQVVAAARSHLAVPKDEKKRKTENEHVSGHSRKAY